MRIRQLQCLHFVDLRCFLKTCKNGNSGKVDEGKAIDEIHGGGGVKIVRRYQHVQDDKISPALQ